VTTVSNHLSDLEEDGVIERYAPIVNYEKVGYDVTAIIHLKVEGSSLPDITTHLESHDQMVSVYEVTGDYDIIAIAKFEDTDDMNDEIKAVLTEPDINEANTSVVLNAPTENRQFDLDTGE